MEQLTDYTINGECSGCGKCCTNILPLSQKEIQKIKSYIGQYKVTPVNRNNVLFYTIELTQKDITEVGE